MIANVNAIIAQKQGPGRHMVLRVHIKQRPGNRAVVRLVPQHAQQQPVTVVPPDIMARQPTEHRDVNNVRRPGHPMSA